MSVDVTTAAEATRSERLLFQPLRLEDAPALLRVHNSNPDFVEATLGPGRRAYLLDEVQDYLREELTASQDLSRVPAIRHHWLLRATCSDDLVGVAELGFVHPRDQIPWIALLELASWQQGKGLAREAAQHLENLVAVYGYQRIGLNVLTSNPRALGFWQRLGYQREESVRGAGLGRAWALSKELDVPNGT
jgi:RimJ/RimL family protein N-acetyltransferase